MEFNFFTFIFLFAILSSVLTLLWLNFRQDKAINKSFNEVPDGFNYNPVVQGSLNVDISGFSSQRAHLSVYKDFKESGSGKYDAKYPSKVVSVPLNNGTANFDFNVSDSQGNLLVEIWFYDGSDPIQKVISSGDSNWIL